MDTKKGRFIVFEGIDGSGKSTQAAYISQFIYEHDKYASIVLTREPYKSREIREILKRDKNSYALADKMTELYVNDRKNHVKELITPCLNNGIHVLSDRFELSTDTYQNLQGVPLDKLIAMHKGMPVPDLTIILDVPISEAKKRSYKELQDEDKFEKVEFQTKLKQKYLEIYAKRKKLFPRHNIILVNGDRSREAIRESLIRKIKPLFS